MAAIPETVYARDGDVHLAYQIVGESGPDLLFVPTATFPIHLLWDEPTVAGHLRRLASFSRLILTDLLGVGSSDAVPINERPAMQSWTDGLVAVLDAVRSESTSVLAMSKTALPVMLLTASHPHRLRSLVLWSPFARYLRDVDYSFGMPEEALARYVDAFGDSVGTGALVDVLAPSWAGEAGKRRWYGRCERLAGGPGYRKAVLDLFLRTDVRPVLGASKRRRCCCTGAVTAMCTASTHSISPNGSRTLDWWSSTVTTTSGSRATPIVCSMRWSRFSPADAGPDPRIVCCRRCCSPTSSDRPSAQPLWATRPGQRSLVPTTAPWS